MGLFRQEGEMNKYIALKSLKISYWFTVLFLLVWAIIDLAKGNRYSVAALALFCFQNSLLVFFDRYYRRKLCEGNEE